MIKKDEWKNIMESYISDDCTTIVLKELENEGLIVLAISYIEGYRNDLQVYVGKDYYDVFDKSGYMGGLLEQDDDYFESMFNEEQIKLIKEEQEKVELENLCIRYNKFYKRLEAYKGDMKDYVKTHKEEIIQILEKGDH